MKRKNKPGQQTYALILTGAVTLLTLLFMRILEMGYVIYSDGCKTLDMTFGSDAKYVYRLLAFMGTEGRGIYIRILVIDFIFITSFLYIQNYILRLVMGKLAKRCGLRHLLWVSYLRAFFDYTENVLILILIICFPRKLEYLAGLLGYITEIKFLWMGIWLILIPVLIYIRRFERQSKIQ